MAQGSWLHRAALAAERGIDRIRPARKSDTPVIDPHRGYSTPEGLVLRGRVLASLRSTAPHPDHGLLDNLKQMAGLFLTDELPGITVCAPAHDVRAVSDEEGYFSLVVPRSAAGDLPGWHEIALEVDGVPASRVGCPVLVTDSRAEIGVISDIDDTMMQTGAYSLALNLWTTFTGSSLTRKVFEDSVVLIDHLSGHGRNPVFYVSSSPWNLHSFLVRVFAQAGLTAGPMFLRDYGLGEGQFITNTHGDHKGAAIDLILEANPGLPFVLIGDTGQHDAEVYLEAAHRHGGRIAAVILREPGPGPDEASRVAMASMKRLGLRVEHGSDFYGLAEALERSGIGPGRS
ncbi:App1 family protein [Profundibacterium mesophilum]|uniref:Phosphatidate phosphatase APP1 catalytic domain-containing protein n=1 Tax=Profundibacterium mesophilum KAUST100406-0324 TaxID=1037889 RepID=A0A921NUQ0_9RHOB|nr:phosphatase domain-containing protein [Profundibacterium mesophilum]KAF0675918.1 hypothetical protein PMES_01673 [Profundibacterium mesophilum KAUST100406-0324]